MKEDAELIELISNSFNNRNACADDEGDDIKDLVDTDFAFKPSLAQKSGSHGHGSTHHHENPDVKNLGSLSREVLGKDVQSPKEKEKEEQKRIFAKAARTEARLKKSLHDEVSDVGHGNTPVAPRRHSSHDTVAGHRARRRARPHAWHGRALAAHLEALLLQLWSLDIKVV